MMVDGQFCPQFEFAPHSLEGSVAISVGSRAGAQRIDGYSGRVMGIDVQAALLALDSRLEVDRDALVGLLIQFEAGLIVGSAERAQRDRDAAEWQREAMKHNA